MAHSKRIIQIAIFSLITTVTVFAQKESDALLNTVYTSIDPELTVLSFSLMGYTGFGLEADYGRHIKKNYSLMAAIKYMHINAEGFVFSTWDISLHNRFKILESGYFATIKMGFLLYKTPYYEDWNMIINPGMETGYTFIIKSRFLIEPYFGVNVYNDDKFLIPFTISSLSEYVFPGLVIGIRYGVSF